MEDEPVYKPRQARGTPTYRYATKVGIILGLAGFSCHFLYAYLLKDRLYRKIASGFYDPTEHIKKRRKIMSTLKVIPNTRDAPVQEYDDFTKDLDFMADSPLDHDLR